MGASISCALFEKFSTFIEWAVKSKCRSAAPAVTHYLDDFLFGGRSGTNECQEVIDTFQHFCNKLGVPLALDKTKGPTTTITFLGIEFDTVHMVLRLPSEKLSNLRLQILSILEKKKVSLRELQSMLGLLNFACRVVRPGRTFCRRLIDSTIGIRKPHHRIRVNNAMREDLNLWLSFLDSFNGVTVMPDSLWTSNGELELYTDSAGGAHVGFGIYFQGKWAHSVWPEEWLHSDLQRNITFLELFPVVVSFYLWGSQFQNRKILFHIDNQAVVHIINKKSSKDKHVMRLLRRLVLLTLKHNTLLKAQHIPGSQNSVSDAISRCQWGRFKELVPNADPFPVKLPQEIWEF